MFLFNKKMLAVSLAAAVILCTSCNTTKSSKDTDADNTGAEISIGGEAPQESSGPTENEKLEIKIGLIKNSGAALGATPLFINSDDGSAYEKYIPVVYNTADEVAKAFIDNEIEVAVMPPDKAMECYISTDCCVAAVTGGSNYYIAENGTSINSFEDINGKTITVSAEDDMAETVLNIITEEMGIDISYKTVESNKLLIDGLKNGSISLALTQEPYLSYVTDENVRSAIDLYDYWNEAVDSEMVSSCLVVKRDFITKNNSAFQYFLKDYNAAAQIAKRDFAATSEAANKFAVADNIDACKAAIPGCGVMFKTDKTMQKMLSDFYNAVDKSGSDILKGMPDTNFYYIQE